MSVLVFENSDGVDNSILIKIYPIFGGPMFLDLDFFITPFLKFICSDQVSKLFMAC